jgi:hypothetical protein
MSSSASSDDIVTAKRDSRSRDSPEFFDDDGAPRPPNPAADNTPGASTRRLSPTGTTRAKFRAKRARVASGSGEWGHTLPDAEGGRPRSCHAASRLPFLPPGDASTQFPRRPSRLAATAKGGLKLSAGPIWTVEPAVAEGVRATAALHIGASPTLRTQRWAGDPGPRRGTLRTDSPTPRRRHKPFGYRIRPIRRSREAGVPLRGDRRR